MTGPQLVAAMLRLGAVLYAGAVVGYLMAGRPYMGMALAGYAWSNVFLILDAWR